MKNNTCARAGKALSKGDARVRAPRASDSTAAADVRDGVAEVEHVQHHVEEEHELEHDENAEPVHAAVHTGELVCAARVRECGSRAGELAA